MLGAAEVILDGRRLGAFDALRLQRFLALIALRRDLQHRSRLSFELWPDSNERQARTNLRKLLHVFRHSLPDIGQFVQIDNEIVRWIPTGPSEVDVLRFRDAIAAGDLTMAERLLGRPVMIAATADRHADDEAAPLHFPWPMALPPDGSYACRVEDVPATMRIQDGTASLEGRGVAPGRVRLTLLA